MRVMVVGGSGLIGAAVAHALTGRGHDVMLAGRTPPVDEPLIGDLPFVPLDYMDRESPEGLSGVEGLVFAAGQDVRHVSGWRSGRDQEVDWARLQTEAIPRFFVHARAAGVRRAVHIGSYYHCVRPDLIDVVPYVRARALAETRVNALSTSDFNVCTVNPPSVIGATTTRSLEAFARLVDWADGRTDFPDVVPPGGANYMSVRSLATAVIAALESGGSGSSYLVGDEDLSFADYFALVFSEAGSKRRVRVASGEHVTHPMVPAGKLIAGEGAQLVVPRGRIADDLLGFPLNDVRRAIAVSVSAVRTGLPAY